jgi:predicted RNA-binding Zn ribbon-like protein
MRETKPERTFELVAGHLSLDFVNTLDWRFRSEGPEELLKHYDDLLRFLEESKMLRLKQARLLQRTASPNHQQQVLESGKEFREALAEVFYSSLDKRTPSAASMATLQRFFQSAQSRQKLVWKEGRAHWDWSDTENEAEFPLWVLSLSASDLLTSEAMGRVRECDNPECRWVFLDISKNHTRRWCDMKVCGNRMKARRFKAQRS